MIYFARHGECYANVDKIFAGNEPSGLTPEGVKQAERLAKIAELSGVTAVYSATLERSKQTADIVAGYLGINYVELSDLKERDYGPFSGQKISVIAESIPDFSAVEGIEPPQELLRRTFRAIERIEKESPFGVTLAITHGSNIKIMREYMLGTQADIATYYLRPGVSNCMILPIRRDLKFPQRIPE